uniref:Peptidase S1 domain-containing protein n=1 Tax=Varanus komodoensis TaxID=61221 RepID=A0A8D2IUJ4_VARKO
MPPARHGGEEYLNMPSLTYIIGGKESIPHSRPYMVALKSTSSNRLFCGGSLIKQNWVLTAAHCYWQKEFMQDTTIILGAHSWIEKEKTQQYFKIAQIFIHPAYNSTTHDNDAMLLKLHRTANINRYVKTIPLPSTTSFTDVKPGTMCLVAGWGTTSNKYITVTEKLREVNIKVINRRICKEQYIAQHPVTENMICAGDENGGKDSCNDSGGPLICDDEQRGIVSFGMTCGDRRYPGVYTALTKFHLNWIEELTGVVTD